MQINLPEQFEAISHDLRGYLYRLCANKEDVNDLLQDTYLKVNDNINSFKGASTFKTWVFAIATNLARDNKRVQNRWKVDAQDDCKTATMQSETHSSNLVKAFQSQTVNKFELAEHMNYCFTCLAKNLTLNQQIALILKEIYDFKRIEIANILNVTEGVVKHLLHDARTEINEKYHHRCAMINKQGICYQCAELSDFLEGNQNAADKIKALGMYIEKVKGETLDKRFEIISRINPFNTNGANLEDLIMQILRETIADDK